MPRNEDFPEYRGIKAEHAGGFNARDYHNRTNQPLNPDKKKKSSGTKSRPRVQPQPLRAMRNVVRPPSANISPPPAKETTLYDHQLEKAKMKDWRSRGITNNEIIDH